MWPVCKIWHFWCLTLISWSLIQLWGQIKKLQFVVHVVISNWKTWILIQIVDCLFYFIGFIRRKKTYQCTCCFSSHQIHSNVKHWAFPVEDKFRSKWPQASPCRVWWGWMRAQWMKIVSHSTSVRALRRRSTESYRGRNILAALWSSCHHEGPSLAR